MARVWTTFAGSFGRSAERLRREVRASVSASNLSAGTRARPPAGLRVRVGDVAGERDLPAALERRPRGTRRGEAVEDDRAAEPAQPASVSSSAARVWITTGLPELGRERRAAPRTAALPSAARSRGGSRARSRRRRRRVGCASRSRSTSRLVGPRPRPPRGDGCRAPRRRLRAGRRSRASSPVSMPVPTVTIRVTPASRARETRRPPASSQRRDARVCRSRRGGPAASARAPPRRRSRVELLEQRRGCGASGRAQRRWAPSADPAP